MTEQALRTGLVNVNGVRIAYYDEGDPDHTAVIMLPGATATAGSFIREYYEPLLEAGFRVIRVDNRDVGRSEWRDYAEHPYTVDDMAGDVVGLMDELGIARAHLIGTSLGGLVCQVVALTYPDRVITLTLQISSPSFLSDPRLPYPNVEVLQGVMGVPAPEDPDELIEYRLNIFRALYGSRFPFDEEVFRQRIFEENEVGYNPNAHRDPRITGESRIDRLAEIAVPTLVVHGTEDPLVPYEHGVALAEGIPGAKLFTMEGVGHTLPRPILPELTASIAAHLREATESRG